MTAKSRKPPRWGRSATNALELLHAANWRWAAIAVHVSAVDGVERTPKACRRKAQEISITSHERKSWRAYDHLLDDLYDLMVLDYTAAEIVGALHGQYGVRVTEHWVSTAGRRLPPNVHRRWAQRRHERMSRVKSAKRRSAA